MDRRGHRRRPTGPRAAPTADGGPPEDDRQAMELPTMITAARRELGLPDVGPDVAPLAGATTRPVAGIMTLAATAPAAAQGAAALAPQVDAIHATIQSLGGRSRPATQALAELANGEPTVIGPDQLPADPARQRAARAMLSSLYVDAAQHGEASMPRAPKLDGNRVDLLVRNEQYLPRLYEDLEGAKHSITVNQFNWEPDGSGERVAALLEQKARVGVDVRVLVDGYGIRERGADVADVLQQRLESAGVRFRRTGGMRPGGSGFEHRKLITIDDDVAYTGGLGFGSKYDGWTDLMVRIQGPAAALAAANSLASHTQHQGAHDAALPSRLGSLHRRITDAVTGAGQLQPGSVTPAPLADARAAVTLLDNRPGTDLASSEAFLRDVAAAKHRLWATSTYITTPVAADALIAAAKRGVDVKLLMTGPKAGNDQKMLALGRALYRPLIDGGVELYEYPSILHSKSWVKDDDVAAVGSMNLSRSSMARAREITARVEDPAFAATYARFHEDTRAGAELVTRDQVGGVAVAAAGLLGKLGIHF